MAKLGTTASIRLTGKAASPGVAQGRARIVEPFCDLSEVQLDSRDVLVARFTTPVLTPLLLDAKAIVTDMGGVTCHAASLARELGIPCVVGTREATTRLQNGMLIRVDGDRGVVYG